MSETWIVRRKEERGATISTLELQEEEASALYANWAGNAKKYNDQSICLVKIEHTEKIVSTHVNTSYVKP